MQDGYGREIDYLRLSVTDLCNYRCVYCMGPEGVAKRSHADILSIEECVEIGRAAVACGVRKIRVTGENRWCAGEFWSCAEGCGKSPGWRNCVSLPMEAAWRSWPLPCGRPVWTG